MNLPANIQTKVSLILSDSIKSIRQSIKDGGTNVRALKNGGMETSQVIAWMLTKTNGLLGGEMNEGQISGLSDDLIDEYHHWNLNHFRLMLIFGRRLKYGKIYKLDYKEIMRWANEFDQEFLTTLEIIHIETKGNEARVRDDYIDRQQKPELIDKLIEDNKKLRAKINRKDGNKKT